MARAPGLPALKARAAAADRKALRETLDPKGTYRQMFTRCGKAACLRCKVRPAHGPYWYLEVYEGTRNRTRYVGKRLPVAILEHVAQFGHASAAAAAAEQLAAMGAE